MEKKTCKNLYIKWAVSRPDQYVTNLTTCRHPKQARCVLTSSDSAVDQSVPPVITTITEKVNPLVQWRSIQVGLKFLMGLCMYLHVSKIFDFIQDLIERKYFEWWVPVSGIGLYSAICSLTAICLYSGVLICCL